MAKTGQKAGQTNREVRVILNDDDSAFSLV